MIKHKEKDWVVLGNAQVINGSIDESEISQRMPHHESLEDELLRRNGDQWDRIPGTLKDYLILTQNY